MRPLFRFVLFFAFTLLISVSARAEFRGCHNWCGKQSNNAWWAVMNSHGVRSGNPAAQAPYRAQANAAKERAFDACMQQTLAEGKRSDADCDGATPPNENNDEPSTEAACRAQALEVISRCEGNYGSANSACAATKVDGVVQQAQSANEQRLQQSQNNAQACGATAQAYQNAVNQLGSVQSSCQSSVSQCVSECERAQAAIQQCADSEVRAKAPEVSTAQQNCSSGGLSKRPVEIARTSDSLRQVGAGDANRCSQSTSAGTNANPSGNSGGSSPNTASGTLNPSIGGTTNQSGSSGGGGNFGSGSGANPTLGNSVSTNLGSGSGSSGIDETYNVSGKNMTTSSGGDDAIAAANAALAALPGTPSQADNSEKNETQSGKESSTQAAASGAGAGEGGGRGGAGRLMLLPQQAGAARTGLAGATGTLVGQTAAERHPDLSAFLPNQRGLAGGVIAGRLAGCRIPDPANPKQCAVPHGPSVNIWSEVKERFEILRNAPPPSDYFFNEE